MSEKIKLGDKEYDVENVSDQAMVWLGSYQFTTKRLQELKDLQEIFQRAKNSYVEAIKKEIISSKTGIMFGED
jgi:hypothetical protein